MTHVTDLCEKFVRQTPIRKASRYKSLDKGLRFSPRPHLG